jgi:hypothetical protein
LQNLGGLTRARTSFDLYHIRRFLLSLGLSRDKEGTIIMASWTEREREPIQIRDMMARLGSIQEVVSYPG